MPASIEKLRRGMIRFVGITALTIASCSPVETPALNSPTRFTESASTSTKIPTPERENLKKTEVQPLQTVEIIIPTSTPFPFPTTSSSLPNPSLTRPVRLIDVPEAGIKAPPTLRSVTPIPSTPVPKPPEKPTSQPIPLATPKPEQTPSTEMITSSDVRTLISQEIFIPNTVPGWFDTWPFVTSSEINPENIFFTGANNKITRYNLSGEKVSWVSEITGTTVDANKNTAYVRSNEGKLIALSSDSGKKLWEIKFTTPGYDGQPVRVYTKNSILQITMVDGTKNAQNSVYTVFADSETGNMLWWTKDNIVKVSNTVAFAHRIGGFDIATGNKLYDDTLKPNIWQQNYYYPDEPFIYAEDDFKNAGKPGIIAFNIDSGKIEWQREKKQTESSLNLNASYFKKWMYFAVSFKGSQKPQVVALDPATGLEKWASQIADTPVNISENEDRILIYDVNNKSTNLLDQASGNPIWKQPLSGFAFNRFRGFHGNVTVLEAWDSGPNHKPTILAGIETQTGAILWKLELPYNNDVHPTALDGKIAIVENGSVKIISAQDKRELAKAENINPSTFLGIGHNQLLAINGKPGSTGQVIILKA